MRSCAALLVSLVLAACASAPTAPPSDRLFNDHLFGPPSERIDARDVFAVSDAMRRFLATEIEGQSRTRGQQKAFIEALYTKGQLRLEYDSVITKNASQAFDTHSGNCLSLVIMTAAMAKELGLAFQFQRVYVDDTWRRSGDVYFTVGHVNLGLGRRKLDGGFGRNDNDLVTIDFLPPQDLRGVHTGVLSEETIIAMYMNNRAAETLIRGQLDDAYWWASAAMRQDPGFVSSYNTLGVIYRHHGNNIEAERVLRRALALEPGNTQVMTNLVPLLKDLGRGEESTMLARRLEVLDPDPPYSYFNRGMAALRKSDFTAARALFAKEIDRAPYNHEFHYWLALTYAGMGDGEAAGKEMAIALEYSSTRRDHDLYAAKLDRIRSSLMH